VHPPGLIVSQPDGGRGGIRLGQDAVALQGLLFENAQFEIQVGGHLGGVEVAIRPDQGHLAQRRIGEYGEAIPVVRDDPQVHHPVDDSAKLVRLGDRVCVHHLGAGQKRQVEAVHVGDVEEQSRDVGVGNDRKLGGAPIVTLAGKEEQLL